jgi:N-acetylglutamate synthase-like GNAT family acetyltransferase
MKNFIYRQQIQHSDIGAIADIVKSSGFFSTEEVDIALELAEEKLTQPYDSSYQFLFAEDEKRVVGYTCFGLISATAGSYDLYWIAIDEQLRGAGLGKDLMKRTEKIIHALSGKRIYVETSSRHQYQPTHGFYESCGYRKEAVLKDFYMEGDSKIIYVKTL